MWGASARIFIFSLCRQKLCMDMHMDEISARVVHKNAFMNQESRHSCLFCFVLFCFLWKNDYSVISCWSVMSLFLSSLSFLFLNAYKHIYSYINARLYALECGELALFLLQSLSLLFSALLLHQLLTMSNKAFGTAKDVDPDLPLSPEGSTYHLSCTSKDLAERIILVGDPGRVKVVADYFDKGSISFESAHREINIATGTYKGKRVSCVSTGMGTDNVEIVVNEIHVLKEYDVEKRGWRPRLGAVNAKVESAGAPLFDPSSIKLIRVGTCGTPRDDVELGSLAITRYGIGLDNTAQYYLPAEEIQNSPGVQEVLKQVKEQTTLGKHIQIYATKAAPQITNGLVAAAEAFNKDHAASPQGFFVGTTCSSSGFYGCQGRAVGHFVGKLRVPELMKELGALRFSVPEGEEKVGNMEMENSSLCFLSNILGYQGGTICPVVARRSATNRGFATPDETSKALGNAITIALEALAAMDA